MKQHAVALALAAGVLTTTSVLAEDFDWRKYEGTEITWAYDIHPYAPMPSSRILMNSKS